MRRHQRVNVNVNRPFRSARSHFGRCSHRGCVTVGTSRGESGEASGCDCSCSSSSSSESDEESEEGSARAEMCAAALDLEEDMAVVRRVRLSRRDETKGPVVLLLLLRGMQCCR